MLRHTSLALLLALPFAPAIAQSSIDQLPALPPVAPPTGFGLGLALLDDIDADGLRDVAVAVARSTDGWIEVRSGRTGEVLRTLPAGTSATQAATLAAIDDVDGDGYRDLLAGWQLHGASAGMVELFSGRTGRRLFVRIGDAADWSLGAAVASAGDIDLDGVPDFAAGAPGRDATGPGGGTNVGLVRIWSGATGAVLWQGALGGPHSRCGSAITCLGDLDGDGRPTIAIGSPASGYVYLVEPLGDTATTTIGSGNAIIEFGLSLATVADLDGDGKRDLIVGVPWFLLPGHAAPGGRVEVYGSVSHNLLCGAYGSLERRYLGSDVGEAGDVDLDGTPDIFASGFGHMPSSGPPLVGLSVFVSGATGAVTTQTPIGGRHASALGEDADGDGRPDLWLASPSKVEVVRLGHPLQQSADDLVLTPWSGASVGGAVALLDDLDADGVAEVAVGAPAAAPGGLAGQGAVRVYSAGQLLFALDGLEAEHFGAAVTALGDLDGDGVGEFAVGRPAARFGFATRCGAVTVFSGATATAMRSHFGVAFGDRFGQSIARLPDTDGDGVDDYAIGAPQVTPASGLVAAGRVSVFSGATGAHRFSIDGTLWRGAFGAAVAGSGDLDGDGRGDLLIGAPGEWTSLTNFGAGRVHRRSGASGTSLGVVVGSQVGMRLGSSLASVGDLTGDGRSEFVVGAPRYGVVADGDGRVELRDGQSGALLWSDHGAFGSRLGSAVVGPGDIDNDGVPDFAVGEPLALELAAGERRGAVRFYSGAGPSFYSVAYGADDAERFGESVASGADLDGDGFVDLAIGSPGRGVPGGATSLMHGAAATWTARALGSEAVGGGTPGCAGPHRLSVFRPVRTGQTMQLRASGMASLVLPLLVVGTTVYPNGVPALGMLLHVDPQLIVGMPLANGTHVTHLEPVPANPVLVGAELRLQVVPFWPLGCAALTSDLSSSNALVATIL
ncbi:MAG: FG-GAP-like repeat-containing protein [Planctomycetota bacterium]